MTILLSHVRIPAVFQVQLFLGTGLSQERNSPCPFQRLRYEPSAAPAVTHGPILLWNRCSPREERSRQNLGDPTPER